MILVETLFAIAFCATFDDIPSLTNDNFTSITQQTPTMVMFYQSWCPHCQRLMSDFTALHMNNSTQSIKYARVNCETERDLCDSFSTTGVPTLRLFQKGTNTLFDGERTVDGIASWGSRHILGPITPLNETMTPQVFVQSVEHALIGTFPKEEGPEWVTFSDLCTKGKNDFVCARVLDPESKPALKMIHANTDFEDTFDGPWKEEDLRAFVRTTSHALVTPYHPFNAFSLSNSTLPVGYFFLNFSSPNATSEQSELDTLAKSTHRQLQLVVVDDAAFPTLRPLLGMGRQHRFAVEMFGKEAMVLSARPTRLHFVWDEAEPLAQFVQNVLDGRVEHTARSADPASVFSTGPVGLLVGSTFARTVEEEWASDVFVRACFGNNPTCNRTAPLFRRVAKELAESTASSPSIKLYEINLAHNDVPPVLADAVSKQPALLFFPASPTKASLTERAKDLVLCDKWFSFEKMKKFLQTQWSNNSSKTKRSVFPLTVDETTIQDEDLVFQFRQRQFTKLNNMAPNPHGSDHIEL
ncbi:putative Protein disulfide-isomerase [Blattamonas nauphoetae]|uniref:Thioredoxin domain-containing protein n=1 Tax=Blattamonas nauphoetae TaxID=2049346 RepID=A0ABQ9XFE5_9EUKA|nr:putative Protein disulfide-isomerase [Blattamonas nauphoetae]